MAEQLSNLPIDEQKKLDFRKKLDFLVEETDNWSGSFYKHPQAQELALLGEEAVPWLLEYIVEFKQERTQDKNPWVAFDLLRITIPEQGQPQLPEEIRGQLSPLLDFYQTWGMEKGYLQEE